LVKKLESKAILEDAFYRYASPEEIKIFEGLRVCELEVVGTSKD